MILCRFRVTFNMINVRDFTRMNLPEFQIWYGCYEVSVMSFGLTNVLTTFMDIMIRAFNQYLKIFVNVYIDYILIYTQSEDKHVENLRNVL